MAISKEQVTLPEIPYREGLRWHGGRLIGRILQENGVKYSFGVMGGHLYALEAAWQEYGIKRIHMRHEQAGAYAADAYGRCTQSPGICYGTAGPGMTNAVSGINQAFLARSPVVAIFGQHNPEHNLRGAFQEGYGPEVCSTMAKWTAFVDEWRLIPMYLRKALRDCLLYPPGPVVLAIPPKAINAAGRETDLVGDVPNKAKASPAPAPGNPQAVEDAVALLLKAERPVIIAGDGVYWANAAPELRELVELLDIPVIGRRLARGSLPETHPLAVHAAWRSQFWPSADVVLALGIKLSNLEGFGEPPAWPVEAKRIVVHESYTDVWAPLPTAVEIIGNPKLVLQQMIELARGRSQKVLSRVSWLKHLRHTRENFEKLMSESIEEMRDWKPVHAFVLGKAIVDVLDDDATVVFDSYTGTAHLTDKLKAKLPGHVLDAGECGGVGHGIAMGIGAQLARPGRQVVVMMGDAGMGIDGMDIETAVRYNLPVVYVVYNNSTWMGGTEMVYFKGQVDTWAMLPNIRYDKLSEVFGCHGEYVTEPDQLRPALERAFNSGKPAVVNVITDDRVPSPSHLAFRYRQGLAQLLDNAKIPQETRDLVFKGYTPEVEAAMRAKGWPLLRLKGKVSHRDMAP